MTSRVQFAQQLTDVCIRFAEEMCDVKFYSYQRVIADRLFFSLIIGDAEEVTVEAARQSGKSEVLACVVATVMVLFPRLAAMYPDDEVLQKFRRGAMVGIFGPIDFQADNLFNRVHDRLTSDHTKDFLKDPEIKDECKPSGDILHMSNSRSFCRKQTAHPKAKIESSSYHFVIVDEAQDADPTMVVKSIHPMLAAYAGTITQVGTPSSHISNYYEAIQQNKRRGPTNGKRNHFAYNWKTAAKENKFYAQYMKKEIDRIGEDSDEFQMSYNLMWLLERGMFITEEELNELSDRQMDVVPFWFDTPIVMGLDVARKHDSTVLTAVWVGWEMADEFGLYPHRVLNWLELHGENWESQYAQICEFVSRYNVLMLGVDAQGMGGPVAERLQVLLPRIEVRALAMNPVDQSERWTHLMQLIQKKRLAWPAARYTRRLMTFKRFTQQMLNVEKEYKGKYLLVGATDSDRNAHDDYIDSLALACALTKDFGQSNDVEVWNTNPFLQKGTGMR